MRRGLIAWSRDEVPAAALAARVARLQAAMSAEALDVVLAHTSFARPAAVSWLTHFVPYWSEALLAVFPSGAPVLLAALTKRVHPWIREVSHVGEIVGAPSLGRSAAALLTQRLGAGARVGVIELDCLPWSVAGPLVGAGFGGALVDAAPLFARIRQPADAAETGLARRARDIASKAIAAVAPQARRAAEVLAAMERAARLEGAEELIVRVAPDLSADATLRRIEGDAVLGARYAVELSLAYKATWVRIAHCFSAGAAPDSWRAAQAWFAESAPRWNASQPGATPPGRLAAWTLEACIGGLPLSAVSDDSQPQAGSGGPATTGRLPEGALAVLSLRLDFPDGPWLGAGPLVVGGSL